MSYLIVLLYLCFVNASSNADRPLDLLPSIPKDLKPVIAEYLHDYEIFKVVVDSISVAPYAMLFERLILRLQSRGSFRDRESTIDDLWMFNRPEFRDLLTRFDFTKAPQAAAIRTGIIRVTTEYARSPALWKYLPRNDRAAYSGMFSVGSKYEPGRIPQQVRDYDGTLFHPLSFQRWGDKIVSIATAFGYMLYIDLMSGESAYLIAEPWYELLWSPNERCTTKIHTLDGQYRFEVSHANSTEASVFIMAGNKMRPLHNLGDDDRMYVEVSFDQGVPDPYVVYIEKEGAPLPSLGIMNVRDMRKVGSLSESVRFFFGKTLPLVYRLFVQPILVSSLMTSMLAHQGIGSTIPAHGRITALLIGSFIGRCLQIRLKSSTGTMFTWNSVGVFLVRLILTQILFRSTRL